MSLGLYIHIPFCLQKCNYCDFVSYPGSSGEEIEGYLKALGQEMRIYSRLLSDDQKRLASLYLGGGTPTCLTAEQLVLVLKMCRDFFSWDPGIEVTVEANPGTISLEKLQALKEEGVNRLSVGAQAFDDSLLSGMGRLHSSGDIEQAVFWAGSAGISNINLDLIYALPGQTLERWEKTLKSALKLNPTHLAVYGLKIEPHTPWGSLVEQGKLLQVEDDLALEMYNLVRFLLKPAGYKHYEISNYAKPGFPGRHNYRYWLNLEYLGLGAAASSSLNGRRFSNVPQLSDYCRRLKRGYPALQEEILLSHREQMEETVFLGLRLLEGVHLASFQRRFGVELMTAFKPQIDKLQKLGLVKEHQGYLRLTSRGLPVANLVFEEFV